MISHNRMIYSLIMKEAIYHPDNVSFSLMNHIYNRFRRPTQEQVYNLVGGAISEQVKDDTL